MHLISPSGFARAFAGTWLAYAALYLCRKNFSVLMPALASDLAFSRDDFARLIFLYSAAYAIGQFLAGTLADRSGAKRIVAFGMILSAVCSASMAGARALSVFGVLQAINGLAQSCGWPGLVKITGAWFDPARRGVLMGWWSTNYVIGGFVATVAATWFTTGPLTPQYSWALGAVGPAILLVLAAGVFWILVTERRTAVTTGGGSTADAWREVFASPTLPSIAFAYFCLKLIRYTFLFWLPLYMVEKLRYGNGEAGYASSAYELVGFAGVPLAGYLSDKVARGRRFPVGIAMMAALAIVCLFFSRLSALGRWENLAVIGLVGILTFGPDTLLGGAATQDSTSAQAMATAAGFVNGVGSIGQLISPFLVAGVVNWLGWDGLFQLFVWTSLAGASALALSWKGEGLVLEAKLANA